MREAVLSGKFVLEGRHKPLALPMGTTKMVESFFSRTYPLMNLTTGVTLVTILLVKEPRVTHSIKIKLTVLHEARIAAVTQKKTLGQWLEEAIAEKIEREKEK